jgi:hypothetical protein
LNVTDAPELRADFRQRCVLAHTEVVHGSAPMQARAERNTVREQAPIASELQSMFPELEPRLVQEICVEALTPLAAVETLLTIAQTDPFAGEGDCAPCCASRAGRDSTHDHLDFPSLVVADGWEVVDAHSIVNGASKGLGQDWCARVKAAAELPTPKSKPIETVPVRRPLELQNKSVDNPDSTELETDYECRQRQGKQRAGNRAKFPRKPRPSHRNEESPTGVTTASDDDRPGVAPAWRSLRLENRL